MNLTITNGNETILAAQSDGMVLVPRLDNERTAAFELLCRALAALSEINPSLFAKEVVTDERPTGSAQCQPDQTADDCERPSTPLDSRILTFRLR